MARKPVLALVGRPNVGKSAIFNRLVGDRISIIADHPGVTRDRIYAQGEWLGRDYIVIDTGGIEMDDQPLMKQIRSQVDIAIQEADVILFVVDSRQGLTSEDEAIAQLLYRSNKPVVLAANKADNPEQRQMVYDFYALGFSDPYPVSAAHGTGLGDVLDDIFNRFPLEESDDRQDQPIAFAFIGQTNVGKSSLVNAILKENRVIVSSQEGTTREAVDTPLENEAGQQFVMIDTAGIRKRGKIDPGIEKYSVLRSLSAIERSDLVCLVIDAQAGIRDQDKHVAGYAYEAGKGIIIVVNKWDAIEKDTHTMQEFESQIRQSFKFLDFAPILFVSAKTGQRLHTLLPEIETVYYNSQRRVPSAILNELVMDAIAINPTPSDKGRRLKVFYLTQVAVGPPTFVVFVNDKDLMHFSYERFLENQLRQAFYFEGTPIKLLVRNRQ